MIDVFAIVEDLKRRIDVGNREVSFIELNRSGAERPTVALLTFTEGSKEPFAFVKAAADPADTVRLQQEFRNLELLQQAADESFRRTVPSPLYCTELNGVGVLAESATPGTRMKNFPPDNYFKSAAFVSHFGIVVSWLSDLHRQMKDVVELPSRVSSDDAAAEIASYREHHTVSPALDALLAETLSALSAANLPGTPFHGDFCTANLVIGDGQEVFTIDWEYPLRRSWPMADLLYFLSSCWCVPYRKGPEALRENYSRLFFEEHGLHDLIRGGVARYAAGVGVALSLSLPLSVMIWVSYANRKRAELTEGRETSANHMPLIMMDGESCLNLDLLARNRDRFLLSGL